MVETLADSLANEQGKGWRLGSPDAISIVRIITAISGIVALTWIIYLLVADEALNIHWSMQLGLAVATFLVSAVVLLQQYFHWQRPTIRLERTIDAILAGQEPIEALSKIGGGPRRMVPTIARALRQLKIQKSQINSAHNEMQQRVASRTDALQRTIGVLRRQAEVDPLTSLNNRRQMQRDLENLLSRCAADNSPLTVLMIDVDHFKLVNDTLGHAVGDRLLADIGQIIRSALRQDDLAYRCGGDEFVIVLPGQDRAAGEGLAQRLRGLVDSLVKAFRLARLPRLSIGVASLRELPEQTAEALMAEADARLYQLKKSSRSTTPLPLAS